MPEAAITDFHLDPESQSASNGLNDYSIPPEECWLYKPTDSSQSTVPIQNWLRDVFDSPSSIFWASRRNLLVRLEAILATGGPIAAYRFGGSTPTLNLTSNQSRQSQQRLPGSPYSVGYDLDSRRGTYVMPSAGSSDSLSTIVNGHMLNMSTSGQPIHSLPPQFSRSQRITSGPSNPPLSHSATGQLNRRRSGSTGKMGSCEALENLQTNVQEIARMQEDTLKADVAALVAAAAGKYGSQHSLGSQGQRTPEGSTYRLVSAPGSPSASSQCLDQLQATEVSDGVSHSPLDRSSLEGVARFSGRANEPAVISNELVSNYIGPHIVDSHAPRYTPQSKPSYPVLPQKPIVPVVPFRTTDGASQLPQSNFHPSLEQKTHFGFRPMRKISSPQFSSKPPTLPIGSRRFPNSPTSSSNEQQY